MSYLDINNNKLVPVVSELNVLLADYSIYYQKLRGFHWNILGENFFDLHEKFEELYQDARVKIDEIAERILTLRYHPVSTFAEYFKTSTIKEVSPLITDREMVKEVLKDHGQILSQMKNVIEKAEAATDEGTVDMMGGYIAELEKSSWMLHAWSKKTHDQLKESKVVSA